MKPDTKQLAAMLSAYRAELDQLRSELGELHAKIGEKSKLISAVEFVLDSELDQTVLRASDLDRVGPSGEFRNLSMAESAEILLHRSPGGLHVNKILEELVHGGYPHIGANSPQAIRTCLDRNKKFICLGRNVFRLRSFTAESDFETSEQKDYCHA